MKPSQLASIVFFAFQTIVWASRNDNQNTLRKESRVKEFAGFEVTILENKPGNANLKSKKIRNKEPSQRKHTSKRVNSLIEKGKRGKVLFLSQNNDNQSRVQRMITSGLVVLVVGGVSYYLAPTGSGPLITKFLTEPWIWAAGNIAQCFEWSWQLSQKEIETGLAVWALYKSGF